LITVEDLKLKAKTIPKKQLLPIWKTLTSKPFPKVKAYQLSDYDFDRIIRLKRCEEDEQREIEEWNTILTTEGTDACVFNPDLASGLDFMILIRENPYHELEKILKHELTHIANGDL
jgi:hypothetical protein